ncbi:enoyl-CoA hydratase/isomerase family protein [Flavobacterium sp. TP390]|uniref:Enoyl-CoA hydratase/isomerase family protein n=1 Tax=Flavobacterium profundi TaxID=1774945 RepID=A0A6I4IJG7_9FLAO|nr:enoyl-CoA hydratase/isomerase family protein [Flavobacterium profundi]MVO09865.1 enoyl-CoA hydratase/isomerase family protein [Flavobacterium profundi]
MEPRITTTIQNHIAIISFFHPAGNSFPSLQLHQLTQEINQVGKSENIHVIVLKSEGEGAFCAGASFDELLQVSNLEEGNHFFSGFANVINAMRKCPKLIIGRAQGKAVGGGVGLLAACDYVLAHENAAIKLSELAIGIGPFVIEPAVTKKIGKTAMAAMTLEATQWKSAAWANEKGLFSQVFSSMETLDETVLQFSEQLASYNPDALLEMKKVLWEGTEHWDTLLYERAAISGRLVLSDFTKKALAQFKQK